MAAYRDKKAIKLDFFKLPPLADAAISEREKWVKIWRCGINTVNNLLTLQFDLFWAKLIEEPKIMLFIDTFLEEFPRYWDVDQMKLYFQGDSDVRTVATEMHKKIFMVIYRASLFKEKNECLSRKEVENSSQELLSKMTSNTHYFFESLRENTVRKNEISETLFKRWIYDNRIFTVERLLNIISIYWKDNEIGVQSILERTVGVQSSFLRDIIGSVVSFADCLPKAISKLSDLLPVLNTDAAAYDELDSILSLCNDILYAVPKLVSSCSMSIQLKDACFAFCSSIPSFMEFLESKALPKIEDYFSATASGSAEGDFLSMVDYVRGSSFSAFRFLIGLQDEEERFFGTLQDALVYEKFMFYYNMEYPLETAFLQNLSGSKHLNYINEGLTEIAFKQKSAILERLEKDGMLTNLGTPSDAAVSAQIESLVELLPHFSPEFVHLCLRNYGYSLEKTTDALLDTTSLPYDLRALINVELVSKASSRCGTGAFFGTSDDNAIEDVNSVIKEESSSGLICMRPIIKESSYGKELNKKDTELEDISSEQNLRNALALLKLQETTVFEQRVMEPQQRGIENQALVKLRSGIEKFYVPEADKVALRPSYEKYCYEEKPSSLWDAYEDEYDDTMDDHQAYNVDVKNDPDEEILPGIEPNRNRLIEVGNEVKRTEITEEEDQANLGRGKRAREKAKKMESANAALGEAQIQKVEEEVIAPEPQMSYVREESGAGSIRGRGRSFRNRGGSRDGAYTGGHQRQLKERHKGSEKRRGADRKRRGGMF